MCEVANRIWTVCKRVAHLAFVQPPSAEYTDRVARLLLGTCAQESGLIWTRQRTPRWEGSVGGFSRWQLEPASISASLSVLDSRVDLSARCATLVFRDSRAPWNALQLMGLESILWTMRTDESDTLGCLMARLHYLRCPGLIPEDLEGQAAYWKAHYNTVAGKGTVSQYLTSWSRLCVGRVEW